MSDEKDVLINFVGNTDALQPAENALDNIIDKGDAIGQAWKKTSAIINDETKKSTDSTSKLAKSIDSMATAAKSMDKVVIGGAYKQYLTQIQSQLGLTNKELISYVQNARKAAQEAIVTAKTDKEAKELTMTVEVMNEQLVQLQKNSGDTGDKVAYLRTRLLEAKEQFAELVAKGVQSGPVFDAAKNKLSDLALQMRDVNEATKNLGSQHKNLDGLISLAGGVAGGFAVAQGAAALFGDQNEDVQRALLKVNAAMSILQGLQTVQNALLKESAGSLLLGNLFRKEAVASTGAQAVATEGLVVAEGAQVVATEAATGAQVELNTAMSLNPVGLLIVGVLGLIAAINIFSDSNQVAGEMQREMNDALKEAGQLLDEDIRSLEHYSSLQIALAKQRGASSVEIAKMEGEASNQKLTLINKERNELGKKYNEEADAIQRLQTMGVSVDKDVLDSHAKLLDKQLELDKKYQDERNANEVRAIEYRKSLQDRELKSFIAFQEAKVSSQIAGSDAERTAQIEAIRATSKAKKELNPDLTPGELAKIEADEERQIRGLQLQNYQHYLKGRTSLYDSYIADAKLQIIKNETDTLASLNKVTDAEIDALKKRRDEALKSDPNLNRGETRKIVSDTNLAIAELEKTKQARIYEIKKSAINAQLILAQKGTQAEYDFKIKAINNEELLELSAAQVTYARRVEIEAKFRKQREDALRSFYESQLQDQISYTNTELEKFGIGEDLKIALVLKRLEEQRSLEISQADKNAAKIAEVNAKYDRQITEEKKKYFELLYASWKKQYDLQKAGRISDLNDEISNNNLSVKSRRDAVDELEAIGLKEVRIRRTILLMQNIEHAISDKEYIAETQDNDNKETEIKKKGIKEREALDQEALQDTIKRLHVVLSFFTTGLNATMGNTLFGTVITQLDAFAATAEKTFEKLKAGEIKTIDAIKEIAAAAIQAAQSVVNQIFADASASRQQILSDEIAVLEAQKLKELGADNLSAQQKADITERYRQRENQEKLKAWKADKDAKKTQAIINGALAATLAFAEYVWPYNLIVAGITAALTAVEVSEINSQSPPRFKHGVINIDGPGTSTSDSIHARISKGESVINADSTAKWQDALEAINSGKFDDYLMNKFQNFVFPQLPGDISTSSSGVGIDYLQLGRAVAAEMKGIIPAPAQVYNTMDEHGFHSFMIQGSNRTEYKSKRYSMK